MKFKTLVLSLTISLGLVSSLGLAQEQVHFSTAFKAGNYKLALTAVDANQAESALFAFAMFKDKMPYLALDKLSGSSNISAEAKDLWKNELGINSPFWRNSSVVWQRKWSSIFSSEIPNAIQAWSLHDLKTDAEFSRAQILMRNLEGTDPGAWAKWQLALGYALKDRTSIAVDYLQSLIDTKQKAVGEDEILITAARMLYQDNKLDMAMKYYDKISKSSDYWLEALEEKAWIYARLNSFERTLGEMKTILNPAFSSQVGPESYFLGTLANLRLCDYFSIFEILRNFKAHTRDRILEIQKLADTGYNSVSDSSLKRLENGVQNWAQLGAAVDKLPRFINRDEILNRAVTRSRWAHQELKEAQALNTANSSFASRIPLAEKFVRENSNSAPARLKVMAQADQAEMKKILIKLQIVESEAIHRMHVGQTFALKAKATRKPKIKNEIEFPFEDNEVWLDELDHYEASAKGCPLPEKGQKL
jgi:hypothetical protein